MQCHKLGRIHNIQDVKIADCNWIKEGNQRVDVDIETNTGQARLVESMLISLREHIYVFFPKMDKQEKLATLGTRDTKQRQTNQKHNAIWFNSIICIQTQLT